MNDSEQYVSDSIKVWVWSGFYEIDEILLMMEDILEDDCDVGLLEQYANDEITKKNAAEEAWPEITDCDRLDNAFDELNALGIIALHNTGYTMSDGHEDVGEVLRSIDRSKITIKGYCFYHGQDLERVVDGGGLTLAYGDLKAIDDKKVEAGKEIVSVLTKHGFLCEWNEDPGSRINLPEINWQRRNS